jgi:hypothetical protein
MGNLPRIATSESKPLETRILLFIAGAIVVLATAGIYGHVKISSDPLHTIGTALVLDHLYNLLVAAAMFAIFYGVGKRLLSMGGFEWNSFAEEFVFSTSTGAAALALLILAAALAGLLNKYAVGFIFLAALILGGGQLLRLVDVARVVISRDYSRPVEILYIFGFALVVLVMVLRALAPPHAYDEAIYHLAAVKRFLEAASLGPVYDIAQANTHMLLHMLYAPCLMIGADSAAKLLSVGFSLLASCSLYAYARRFLDQITGYVAALAFFGAGMVVEVATTARIDVTLAGFLFLATYSMMVYLQDRLTKWLWLSAFLAGVAISIKLTGLIWVAMLGGVYLVRTMYSGSMRMRARYLGLGAAYFLLLLAVVSPWLLKNLVYFHDPFYPFGGETATDQRSQPISYFGPAEEGKLDSYFQRAKQNNPVVAERIRGILADTAARRPERHPLRFWSYFTHPELYNVAEPYHTPNYLLMICPLLLLFARDKNLISQLIICVMFFVVMVLSAWTARYLVPIYPSLTLIAAYVVVRTTESLRQRSAAARALPLIAIVLTTGATLFVEVSQLIQMRELNYLNGSTSRADFMSQFFYYPSQRFVNENTDREAKVFMVGCQMAYDLQRPYVADATWESTPWRRLLLKADSPEAVREIMRAEGITHVIYTPNLNIFSTLTGSLSSARGGADRNRPDYYEQWRNWTTFEEFKEKFLQPVDEDSYATVFTLR